MQVLIDLAQELHKFWFHLSLLHLVGNLLINRDRHFLLVQIVVLTVLNYLGYLQPYVAQ
jgi:hypothetical protein